MSKNKSMCRGCHNDFYNHREPKGCWSFESAEIVTRIRVGVWENPSYKKERAEKCLSCFNSQGSSMLKLDDCRVSK